MQHQANWCSLTYTVVAALRVIQHTEVDTMLLLFDKIIATSSYILTELGVSSGRSDEHMEFDDSVIPRHLNPCNEYSNSTEGDAIKTN